MNRYLQQTARQDSERDLSSTYIAAPSTTATDIIGYYTITVVSMKPVIVPAQKLLPTRPVPVVLLGRLAVDLRYQKRGIGERLLFSSLSRAIQVAETVRIFAVVVDAKDQRAAAFYSRYGFQPLIDDPLHLFLTMKQIRALVLSLQQQD